MWRLLFFSFTLAAAEPADTIVKLLTEQSEAWNRGDIPAFMRTYENSPDTAYVGAAGVTKGYQQVLVRYQKKYSSRQQMGTLRFTDLTVRPLTADVATVTGRFQLPRQRGRRRRQRLVHAHPAQDRGRVEDCSRSHQLMPVPCHRLAFSQV